MAQAAIDTGDRPVTISIDAERILDTRTNLGLAGRFADATPRDLQVAGSVAVASGGFKTVVPTDAVGVLVNVTVVTPTHEGFLSLRPQGASGEPTTSTVNFFPGAIEPNAATVDLNNERIQIWVETASDSGSADVLIDVVGYTIDHTHDDRYSTKTEIAEVVDSVESLDSRVAALETSQPFAVGARGADLSVLTSVPTELVSVSLTAPTAGSVVVVSSASAQEGGAGEGLDCSITTGSTVDNQYLQTWLSYGQPTSGFDGRASLAGTRFFDVQAGPFSANLVCRYAGTGGVDTAVLDPVLTATFTPAP